MAFSIKAVFGIDTTGVRTEVKQLRKEFNGFVQDYAKLGAGVAVAAFVALSKGALELASSLKDTSEQVGINVEALQALHYAAEQNGSSADEMNKSLEKLRLNTQAAADGNKKYEQALSDLGLSAQQLIGLSLEKRYELIAQSYANATDKGKAYNAVSELFGNKIGPKQIATLESLAKDGFAATAKAAEEAGHVMSSETIVALERAQQAIDDFKKRATVAVGNILVNFQSAEGLKLLGAQLLRAAGVFGAKIVDAIYEGGSIAWAVFRGAFEKLGDSVKNMFISSIQAVAEGVNAILPKRFEIDTQGLESLKTAGRDIGDYISEKIAATQPLGFADTVGAFWDGVIADQKQVVDQLNQVQFGEDARKLENAGRVLTEAGRSAGKAVADGGKEVKDAGNNLADDGKTAGEEIAKGSEEGGGKLKEAAKAISGAVAGIRGGNVFNDLSDAALREVVRQNRNQAQNIRRNDTSFYHLADFEAARLEAEAINAQRELDLRNQFRQDLKVLGEDLARRQYDPIIFEKLLQKVTPATETQKTNQLLGQLNEKLARGITVRALD